MKQQTPDGGESEFKYDQLGRIVFSQNAKQKASSNFSYSLYDDLSRITEAGEMNGKFTLAYDDTTDDLTIDLGNSQIIHVGVFDQATVGAIFDTNQYSLSGEHTDWTFNQLSWVFDQITYDDFRTIVSTLDRTHVVVTEYDGIGSQSWMNYGTVASRNLRNRVSAMYKYGQLLPGGLANYDNAIHYSYDVSGNVNHMYREAKDMGFKISKHFEYIYDQISGNVLEMRYQEGEQDALHHRYTYDGQNRIIQVETSRNGAIWDVDAVYEYYLHGPLAKVVIGDRSIQSVEYAYTLQGLSGSLFYRLFDIEGGSVYFKFDIKTLLGFSVLPTE